MASFYHMDLSFSAAAAVPADKIINAPNNKKG